MLSAGDDFPIHQRPEPVAFAGCDRNFYDRYYFQGYSRDATVFFGAALGVYPHLNLIDGAFFVQRDGVQHRVFASRYRAGSRQIAQASIVGTLPDGGEVSVVIDCGPAIYKQGEGYNRPVWGHGMYHGPSAPAFERVDTGSLDPNDFAQVHLQAVCSAELRRPGRDPARGQGVLEQMIVGVHAPSGFHGMADVAG